ncbi:hypothetical protein [Burkholderia sp. WSM2230]|uniref:hypothetical protein n=1 Tax=Burkholderia sp. WSM2230 TaxID=944435 RepID=UPI0003FF8467|nr:hypothetical protein [Burkholderia sp. WSM2230]
MNTGHSARFLFLPAKEPANRQIVVPTTMADAENIDRFNKFASKTFAILYSFFAEGNPVRRQL